MRADKINHMTKTPLGYHGGYLRILLDDDDSVSSQFVPLKDDVLRSMLGGSGLGVEILLNENQATVAPLSAESGLAFIE